MFQSNFVMIEFCYFILSSHDENILENFRILSSQQYFILSRRKYSGKITLEYSRRNNMKITSYDQILLFSYCPPRAEALSHD